MIPLYLLSPRTADTRSAELSLHPAMGAGDVHPLSVKICDKRAHAGIEDEPPIVGDASQGGSMRIRTR